MNRNANDPPARGLHFACQQDYECICSTCRRDTMMCCIRRDKGNCPVEACGNYLPEGGAAAQTAK